MSIGTEIFWINIVSLFVTLFTCSLVGSWLTNFLPIQLQNCKLILSPALGLADPIWSYSDTEYFNFALEHLKRMFPDFNQSWIIEYRVWRAEYAQQIAERDYSKYLPGFNTPWNNAYISTMAQIYPEDRGTNYAIREGRHAADVIAQALS